MYRKLFFFLFALSLLTFQPDSLRAETVTNVSAEGSCAIVGMSAEQCQLTAVQRARAAAIEQAGGVAVTSSTLVTNMALAADFIKTYSRGLIVREEVRWLPMEQYQKDASTPPVPEYRVRIVADVRIPEPKIKALGVKAKLNTSAFINGDKAFIEVGARRDARVAIFNITAGDRVVMVFPNEHDKENHVRRGSPFVYPDTRTKSELVMHTLKGHERDAEAFLVVCVESGFHKDLTEVFSAGEEMPFSDFFRKYAEIADYAEDTILTYEVIAPKRK